MQGFHVRYSHPLAKRRRGDGKFGQSAPGRWIFLDTNSTYAATAACGAPAVCDVRASGDAPVTAARPEEVCTPPSSAVASSSQRLAYRFAKRVIDIVFSVLVIIVGFIPACILCIVIAATMGGSPIFTQQRLGLRGRPFRMFKFRTMVADAEDVEKYLDADQIVQWECERKVKNDPRVTKLGAFLRRTSLDEVPQFLNVLAGQMSTIGVRPIVAAELRHYGGDAPEFLSLKPGITGWWQVHSRNEAVYEDGGRQKLELYYVRHARLSLDFSIFFSTFKVVFRGTGR